MNTTIFGRQEEREDLEQLYQRNQAEFVAVLGRKRIGKTYLIQKTFSDRIVFHHLGLSPDQLKGLSPRKKLEKQLLAFQVSLINQGYEDAPLPKDWLHAFTLLEMFLKRLDSNKRLLIFLDEIPWLDTPSSLFLTGLEYFWNSWACSQDRVMLVVTGSNVSWMEDRLLHNTGGLYGRVTRPIRLKPFTLHECEEYFKYRNIAMSRYDETVCYMVLGGIPYYLKYLDSSLSLPQNIDNLFFSESAPLKGEFDFLFSSIFTNAEKMKNIITALSEKSIGLTRSELAKRLTRSSGGRLSKDLNALIQSGFVEKYVPYLGSKRQEYYKLVDPFCLFYLRFFKEKQAAGANFFSSHFNSPSFSSWRGLAFENVCFCHIQEIKQALSIGGVSLKVYPYFQKEKDDNQGCLIDLVLDRNDNVISLCEAKFTSTLFEITKDYHLTLVTRRESIQKKVSAKKCVMNVFISTFGLKKNIYSSDFVSVVTLDDLFR